jgi:hypothetical protein
VLAFELFVPDLSAALSGGGVQSAQAPALYRWLSRASLQRRACGSAVQALCERFGVARQSDWPVAALTLRADGLDPGRSWWLRADPVHLQPARNELVLARTGGPDLVQAEADAIVATLDAHLAAEGVHLIAARPQRWYLGVRQPEPLTTTPLREALGRSIDALLPQGASALRWHRRLNELQMLLHEHPVNVRREARGALAVNSVWLWGSGVVPTCPPRPALSVWSDDPLARGLALCAGATGADLPAGAAALLDAVAAGEHLVVLGDEAADTPPALHRLERDWLEPLVSALRGGRLERAGLTTVHDGELLSLHLSRRDLWKFWRRPLAPKAHARA